MKKVLIICEALAGGVRKHVFDLIENLNKDEFSIYLMYSKNRNEIGLNEEIKRIINKKEIHLIENQYLVRNIDAKNDIRAFLNILKLLIQIKPDIVHCHSSKAGALGRVASKMVFVKKIFYTPHAYIMQNQDVSKKKKYIYGVIEKILSRFFTTLTLNVSKGERQFAISNNIDKPQKFKVIYNGINFSKNYIYNTEILKKEVGIKDNEIVIGTAARLDNQKDPFTFMEIAKKVVNENPKVKFIYVGDGILKSKIENYILMNNLKSNVILLGFRRDIESILNIFDIYLITSIYEGLPYSLIEALRSKLPIVATDVVGNNEIVSNEFNGLLFKVRNVQDGVNKINYLLNGKYNINTMKSNSYKLFNEKFTLNKMIKEIEKIYCDK